MSEKSYILPCIMTVKDIMTLPLEIIECFTSVTTKDLESYLNAFINHAEAGSDAKDKEAAAKIQVAYKGYYELIAEINSSDMNETIQLAANTNLVDISYNTESDVLINLKNKFSAVLEGEAKLIKLDEENFKNTTDYMIELAENTGDSTIINTTKNLVKNMRNMSAIFINKNGNVVQGSKLTSALKFKEKMVSLLTAIEDVSFLKERGQGDVSPRTWRCF